MELTSSFQLLKQIHLGNAGSGRAYLRIYARVSSTGYDIPNNRTKVYVKSTLYYENSSYFYTGPPTSKALSCTGLSWQGGDASGTYYQGETTLNETNGYITHNNDGTKEIEVSANFTSQPWGWNGTATAYVTLPKIPRYPTLISGENFTDEGNPTLTFTNQAKIFPIRVKLEAGGNNQLIIRDIDKNSTSYTFNLTDEERKTLRKLATNNSLSVVETVCAMNGETELSSSFQYYTMTIINGEPIFNDFVFEDINEKTINLTGKNQNVILGYSNVQVTIPTENKAIAVKEATMSKYRFNNNEANFSDSENVTIVSNGVTSGEFVVYAIDSRNNSTSKTKSASSVINYNSLIKGNIIASRQNGVSENVELELDGKIDLVDFGTITNSIKSAKYRYKIASETNWSEFNNLTINVDENGNFSFHGLIKGDTDTLGFNIQNAYNVEVYIQDELSEIKYTANFGAGIPHIAYAKNGIGIMGAYDESVGGLLQVDGKRIDNFYSTQEQVIGTWIDGKPIYRRVFKGITYNSTNTTITTEINSYTVEVINVGGYICQKGSPELRLSIGGVLNSNWYVGFYSSDVNIALFHPTNLGNANYVLWVEYTKTTD